MFDSEYIQIVLLYTSTSDTLSGCRAILTQFHLVPSPQSLRAQQEDGNDLEDVQIGAAGGPVTSQPTAGQASGAGMPVFAMPAPPNPTNPFASMTATEATSLNSTDQATYTPGK